MKKFIIFAVSFSLLFILFQVGSGLLLTLTYTPDFADIANYGNLPQETTIIGRQTAAISSFFIAFFAAIIAYFIPGKIIKTS